MATCKKRDVAPALLPADYVLTLNAREAYLVRLCLNTPLTEELAGIDEALRAAGVKL